MPEAPGVSAQPPGRAADRLKRPARLPTQPWLEMTCEDSLEVLIGTMVGNYSESVLEISSRIEMRETEEG